MYRLPPAIPRAINHPGGHRQKQDHGSLFSLCLRKSYSHEEMRPDAARIPHPPRVPDIADYAGLGQGPSASSAGEPCPVRSAPTSKIRRGWVQFSRSGNEASASQGRTAATGAKSRLNVSRSKRQWSKAYEAVADENNAQDAGHQARARLFPFEIFHAHAVGVQDIESRRKKTVNRDAPV